MGKILDYFTHKYNYTDFHELNLDWLISDLMKVIETLDNFVSLNTIKYADPIQWNIATQYESNTVVIDSNNGTAYISTKPVPSGVSLTDPNYWSVIFTLDILSINKNITLRDDSNNPLSTFSSTTNDWLIWNGILYKVIRNINVNEAYVIGYNIERYTIEQFIHDYINNIISIIGNLDNLTTTDKSSVVNAINELHSALKTYYIIDPESYGAIGDGSSDDTAALQACINDAQNKIIVLSGRYKITNTINFIDDVILAGGEIIDAIAPDANAGIGDKYLFHISSRKNITINGVHFTGGTATQYDGNENYKHDLIEVDNSSYISIINNNFDAVNAARTVIFHGSENCHCDNNRFYYSRYLAAGYMNGSKHCTLNNNHYLELGWLGSISYGFVFSSADHNGDYSTLYCIDIDCSYNLIEYVNTLSSWESISAHGAYLCNISHNIITNARFAIACGSENARNFLTINTNISFNTITCRTGSDLSSSFGIYVGGNNLNINDNYIYNAGGVVNNDSVAGSCFAIGFEQFGSKINVYNNYLHNCKGIMFLFGSSGAHASGYRDITIKNNIISGIGYGVVRELLRIVNTALLTTPIRFINNLIESNGVSPIIQGWANTTNANDALIIEGNTFDDTPTYVNTDKIITDYVNTSYAASATLGKQGMLRKFWNAVTSGSAALQLYTNAWHDINLS